jgi:hypothetical protein
VLGARLPFASEFGTHGLAFRLWYAACCVVDRACRPFAQHLHITIEWRRRSNVRGCASIP